MKIGIDARFYGPLGKGLGRYTERLIRNLEKIDSENDYVIFLRKENWDDYSPARCNFKKVLADFRWYSLKEQLLMPLKIYQEKVDLMHFPHFNIPIFYFGPFVVTIHDLILLQFPTKRATTLGPFLYKFKYLAYKITIRQAVKRAKKIIAVSRYTQKEIISYFNINPKKISVIYEACDGVESGQLVIPQKEFLKKYNIVKPYLLYVGNAYPHKNLEKLLYVFKKLKNVSNFNYQLVLVGKEDYFYRRLKKDAQRLSLLNDNSVVFFGFANDSQLASLYRNASLYVFPSFIEGFGLPPLEAMSYGLPVVASRTSCLPEILGEAAVFFDPRDPKDISQKILKVLNNKLLQKELIEKGFKQIKKFKWLKCAQETLKVYKDVKR